MAVDMIDQDLRADGAEIRLQNDTFQTRQQRPAKVSIKFLNSKFYILVACGCRAVIQRKTRKDEHRT